MEVILPLLQNKSQLNDWVWFVFGSNNGLDLISTSSWILAMGMGLGSHKSLNIIRKIVYRL